MSPTSRPSPELQPGLSALAPSPAPSCEAEAVSSVDQGGVSSLEGFQGRFSEQGEMSNRSSEKHYNLISLLRTIDYVRV